MKFVSKAAVALVFALVLVLGMPHFAQASSISGDVTVKPEDGKSITINEVDGSVKITEEIAAGMIDGVNASDLTLLWQKDVKADQLPVTLKFHIAAFQNGMTVYVFHHNGTEWELVATENKQDFEVKFNKLSPVAVLTKKASSSGTTPAGTGTGTNVPDTGDHSSIALWGSLTILAAAGVAGIAIYGKKRRAN